MDRRGRRAAMSAMPTRTPSPMSPAVSRKFESLPLAAGRGDAIAVLVGLATATGDRVADGVGLAVAAGELVGLAVRVGVGLAPAAVGATVGLAAVVAGGDGELVEVPSDAQARESATPGAEAQTDRVGVTHEVPSAAVRKSATRMNG